MIHYIQHAVSRMDVVDAFMVSCTLFVIVACGAALVVEGYNRWRRR